MDWLRRRLGSKSARLREDGADRTRSAPPRASSDWCLVGNIVASPESADPKANLPRFRHFTPGTKVYLMPSQWGDGYGQSVAIGVRRGSRRLVTVVIPVSLTERWRAQVVYSPSIRDRLEKGYGEFHRQWASREEVEGTVSELERRAAGLI